MALGLDKVSTKSAWRQNSKMSEIEQKVRKNKGDYISDGSDLLAIITKSDVYVDWFQ